MCFVAAAVCPLTLIQEVELLSRATLTASLPVRAEPGQVWELSKTLWNNLEQSGTVQPSPQIPPSTGDTWMTSRPAGTCWDLLTLTSCCSGDLALVVLVWDTRAPAAQLAAACRGAFELRLPAGSVEPQDVAIKRILLPLGDSYFLHSPQ